MKLLRRYDYDENFGLGLFTTENEPIYNPITPSQTNPFVPPPPPPSSITSFSPPWHSNLKRKLKMHAVGSLDSSSKSYLSQDESDGDEEDGGANLDLDENRDVEETMTAMQPRETEEASMRDIKGKGKSTLNALPLTEMEELEMLGYIFGEEPLEVQDGVAVTEEAVESHVADLIAQV